MENISPATFRVRANLSPALSGSLRSARRCGANPQPGHGGVGCRAASGLPGGKTLWGGASTQTWSSEGRNGDGDDDDDGDASDDDASVCTMPRSSMLRASISIELYHITSIHQHTAVPHNIHLDSARIAGVSRRRKRGSRQRDTNKQRRLGVKTGETWP